ncbi:DeoR/GlpR family DNA-binding transcription regulator [Microvirga puerhi]|uniref:DeoR/GlpR family DNA-binding transcription regulator n=1 Tax=Microvirga puerhi TaxID=2876078 RepID=A0ABS7VS18_9HYPH|nr:DeoR/GlpR family DNA-binding transcription regulator [Microvirga puerhi]MBZ6078358.1 DeoR/GlpR family DNA-binding transcription regulator [Microvirga puerhi]
MMLPDGKKTARQRLIIAELALSPTVRTSALAQQLGVSTETVRRDIEELTRQGLVSRTYGGATGRQVGMQPEFANREEEAVAERDAIAWAAVALVRPGDVVMIDSGSTTARFAQALAAREVPVTVITNGFAVAGAFRRNDLFRVMVCPGQFIAREQGVYGSETCSFLQRFFADIAFIGASGLTDEGPTEVETEACAVKRTMLARAERRILLIDFSKFHRRHFEVVCPLSVLSDIVADRVPEGTLAERLSENGVTFHAGISGETATSTP